MADVYPWYPGNAPQCSTQCDSYLTFQDLHKEILRRYACLNPVSAEPIQELMEPGPEVELNEFGTEFIRGGIVALMTVWENYVHELFDEAFDTLITICSGPGRSLRRLEEHWGACEGIIKKEMESEEQAYAFVKDTDLGPEKLWMKLLNAHRRTVLDLKTLHPIFDHMARPMTIDGLFMELFAAAEEEESISRMLVYVAKSKPFCLHLGDSDVMVTLHPVDDLALNALHNISRLYYGLRCVFVHGKTEKTLRSGALSMFPEEDFPLPNQDGRSMKARNYTQLYKEIKEKRRRAHVSYLTFLNVANFIHYTAECLMLAVAEWIHEKQFVDSPRFPVWGYTFQAIQEHHSHILF